MTTANDISRAVRDISEHSKNVTAQNIVQAVNDGKLRGIDKSADIAGLLSLVKFSIDQAYMQSGRSLDRTIAGFVETSSKKNL